MAIGPDMRLLEERAFDRHRRWFGPSGSLKILSGAQHGVTEAVYTTGWKFPRKEHTEPETGKQFRVLTVADPDGSRKPKLKAGTAIQVDTVIYKNAAKDPSLDLSGVVTVYEFKIYGTGERV